MSYQVLYRKWRPQSFNDVVGQSHITVTLTNELKLNRIAHAYLFIGSRGTGKTTCAKILAKAVNCLNPIDGNPCGECSMCKGIDDGSIMDVVEMDAASNNGVNDIRLLCEEVSFMPSIAKYRVYIIDEVHMLSQGAFNALLKTLEEPPEHVIFILATTEVHKIPATILSRCQRFEFHRVSVEEISKRLKFVSEKENVSISDEATNLISRIADGGLRDALSLLDKCMGVNKEITINTVTEVAGLAPREHLFKLSDSILNQNPEEALNVINDLNTQSKDMSLLCEELIEHFRNFMLFITMDDPKSIIILSDNEYEKFSELSKKISLSKVINIIDTLELSLDRMSRGCNKRVEIESAVIKLSSSKLSLNFEDLLKRIENLERKSSQIKVEQRNEIESKSKKEEIINRDQIDLSKLTEEAVPLMEWNEILENLKNHSRTVAMAFSESDAYINGDFILINAKKDVAIDMLRNSVQRGKIRTAIKDVMGKSFKLGPYQKSKVEKAKEIISPLKEFVKKAEKSGIKVTLS